MKTPIRFAEAVQRLSSKDGFVTLSIPDSPGRILVATHLQGRVLGSTITGDDGPLLGWVNLDYIEAGKINEQFNPYGGSDRIWIGPEGSQYSIYFDPGEEATFANWRVPAVLDTRVWEVEERGDSWLTFRQPTVIVNQAGTKFEASIERKVQLLSQSEVQEKTGLNIHRDLKWIAYESENELRNEGNNKWSKEQGLLSIWTIGMFPAGPAARIIVPLKSQKTEDGGMPGIVNDDYFGPIGEDRLKVLDNTIVMRADAKSRGKIGVPPDWASSFLGSWDPSIGILTFVHYSGPRASATYLNAKWGTQAEPFVGDVVNAYNDGPTPSGYPLGSFYELETSSPGVELEPGESVSHSHRTLHFKGPRPILDRLARDFLHISLDEIENLLP